MSELSAEHDAGGVYCPGCGYDLRMTEGRCPECGREFVKGELAVSRIPWVHRRAMGRVRAWWRTVWMVLRRPGEVGAEVSRPVAWGDAKRFGWVTILVTTGVMGIVFAGTYRWQDLSGFLVAMRGTWSLEARNPLEYPIYALWTGPGLVAVVVAVMAIGGGAVTWWLRLWFWMLGGERRDRASAVACYGSACVMLVGLLAAVDVGLCARIPALDGMAKGPAISCGVCFYLVHLTGLIWFFVALLRMMSRATHRGWMGVTAGAVGISVGGAVVFGVVGFVVNYVLGLLGLMWASLWG